MDIVGVLASEFAIKKKQVENTIELIDEGNTIPFIARYRKEATGSLSDEVLRDLDERLTYLRNLQLRKDEVIRSIDEQGKLTEKLKENIEKAEVLQRVEDLYKPYKRKKATRASKAKEKGLEPLALYIWKQEEDESDPQTVASEYVNKKKGVESLEDAIKGAKDIIAEIISDDPDIIAEMRKMTEDSGSVQTKAVDENDNTVYNMYYDYSEKISKIPNHRILAINRGEKEKKLKVRIVVDIKKMEGVICKKIIKDQTSSFSGILKEVAEDAYKRLIAPSTEREMRNMLTERAENEAVKIFARNTEKLLMVPPVRSARIISIDPGYRTGCKVAVIDETGKLLAYTTVFPTEPRNDVKGTEDTLGRLVDKYDANTIVIGNGTASRETEEVVAGFIKKKNLDIKYTIVNEAGASVYSASKLATQEYPDLDVTVRGAMSLGRRLQDPLAELVKIPTKSIGVGQYQHDINQTYLEKALDDVVENCVNRVGVDLNTASAPLLERVAGINAAIAKNIVSYREEHGRFKKRSELKKVSKLGEKTYSQCAGFMRIAGGADPLDGTAVHPESYEAAERMLEKLGVDKSELQHGGIRDIENRIRELYENEKNDREQEKIGKNARVKDFKALGAFRDKKKEKSEDISKAIERMAKELDIGVPTLKDIIDEMKKPGRDPRENAPEVIFRRDVRSFDDLKIGMELVGTVRNVVDFGAFVDIGVKNDGLVHISEMSNRYVKNPMDIVSVGDTVKVKIIDIDTERKKVSLTMKV